MVSIPREPTTFIIDNELARRLMRLWQNYVQSSNKEHIDFPLRQWSMALDRAEAEDKIVDHWIGLESLFARESTSEVRYRASLRLPLFLRRNGQERQRIYERAKTIYDWRSAIVHGNRKRLNNSRHKHNPSEINVVSNDTQNFLRDSLLRAIEMSDNFRPDQLESISMHSGDLS